MQYINSFLAFPIAYLQLGNLMYLVIKPSHPLWPLTKAILISSQLQLDSIPTVLFYKSFQCSSDNTYA